MADDVVETLLESHAFARSTLALAERLCSAPSSESTRAVAEQVATFFGEHLLLHFADEESTLAPRLARRHKVLDETLAAMALEHEQLRALLSRVVFLCRLVAADASRLLAVRFELSAAVEHLRSGLLAHQAKEESLLFPAVPAAARLARRGGDARGDGAAARSGRRVHRRLTARHQRSSSSPTQPRHGHGGPQTRRAEPEPDRV